MEILIGRQEEKDLLEGLKNTEKPAFVAVYGRRRVGKTFLVRQVFGKTFSFYFTGTANVNTRQQLSNFHAALVSQFHTAERIPHAKDWFESFSTIEYSS